MERDKLLGTMDAKVWTDEFMATKARLGDEEFDHAMMLAWFANAIMAGFDEANRRAQRALDAEREKVKRLSTCGTDHSTPWWQVKCEDLEAQLATLQAQLRQVEGQSKQQAEEAVIVFAKYTTLQQLVEALINSDTAKDHDKAWFALRATLAAQDAPLTKEQRRIEDCCEKPHDCKWGGIGGCGYDGRKHELRQVAPPHGGTP